MGAKRLLDPSLPPSIEGLASLDSQNRFYATAFAVYGVLLWQCARDPVAHTDVLHTLFAVFFAAGLACLLSVAAVGWPSTPIVVLTVIELTLPAVLIAWLRRQARG